MTDAIPDRGKLHALLLCSVVLPWTACTNAPAATPPGPRVAVVVVVDQMRGDFLDRYADRFTGGLRRLMEEGAVFEDGHQDHAATVTATGHATLSTGVHPYRHGIVGNDFVEEGRFVYSAFDPEAPLLEESTEGQAPAADGAARAARAAARAAAEGRSPRRLLREGLADWLREISPESKVLSVSFKDRSAIMMAGRQPDGVYWYRPQARGMVTSSYYATDYPEWVADFNRSGRVEAFFERSWNRLLPEEMYTASREDSFPVEALGRRFTFPYDFGGFAGEDGSPTPGYYAFLPYTPFGDELLFRFAREGVENEGLGEDETPDLLFIGASGGDYIGHRWGPMSQEVQDYYLRLDRLLGDLFDFLDDRVGPDGYIVALSADHGVGTAPEELLRRGEDARRIDQREFREALLGVVSEALAELEIEAQPRLRFLNGLLISFPDDPGADERLSEVRRAIAAGLREVDFVADAFTAREVEEADPEGSSIVSRFRRSFHPDRSADVMIHLKANHVLGGTPVTHGSAHPYDTHVPILFLGPEIAGGRRSERARSVDVAPTLARLLGFEPPDDLDGRPLDVAGR